ncbi:MAG TPA: hypothetical protein VHE55_09955 [Fimbriimonadaceae bacterium]|nr:hypothetical protein [Fimbriimonadaceae bacterium]
MARGRFGEVLRALIKERYGSQQAFAGHADFSPGRISQLTGGALETISYHVLETLFPFFPPEEQERLYAAWLEDFAPSPLPGEPTSQWDDERIVGYCLAAPSLIGQGGILSVLATTKALWLQACGQPKHFEAAIRAGKTYVETCFALDRHAEGLKAAAEMAGWSKSLREPAGVAEALWLETVGSRAASRAQAEIPMQRFHLLDSYLAAWQPRSLEERRLHHGMTTGIARDGLLIALDLARNQEGDMGVLETHLTRYRSLTQELDEPKDLPIFKEIEARVLVFRGELDRAEEALRIARNITAPIHPAHLIKTEINTARLYLADQDFDRASRSLRLAREACELQRQFHHLAAVSQLEGELVEKQRTRTRPF